MFLQPSIIRKTPFDFHAIQLDVDTEKRYSLPDAEEKIVSVSWKEKFEDSLQTERPEWNGTFYRVENVHEIQNESTLQLSLWTIEYRYLACRKTHGSLYFGVPERYLNFLSVAWLLETADGKFLFGKRLHGGEYDVIWWGITLEETLLATWGDIIAHLYKEIYEEVWVDQSHIVSTKWLWILYSQYSNVLLVPHSRIDIPSERIRTYFMQRPDNEMEDFIIVEREHLEEFLRWMRNYRVLLAELVKHI